MHTDEEIGMTNEQIRWAAQHDWFIARDGDMVIVREDIKHACGSWTSTPLRFGSFKKLREWAGY
jgi:hypothetical protein